MSREQQLQFCKICKNQKFDSTQGIICGLTNQVATFEDQCDTFDEDPYLKEKNIAAEEAKLLSQKTVGAGTRFANYILDIIFFIAFQLFFGIILGIILGIFSPSSLSIFEGENLLLEYILSFIAGMIYYTTLETLTGRTMAKLITRTKVIMENGEKVNFDAILIRSLCRFIPFEAFSFLGDDARGWHDTISKTRVISVK